MARVASPGPGAAAYVLVLVALLALCCSPARTTPASRKSLRSIDCRRLVFHPQCRGVAAKRSMPNLLEGLEARYQLDLGRDASEPVPAPAPAAASSALAALSADPILAGLLGRLAADGSAGRRDGRREAVERDAEPEARLERQEGPGLNAEGDARDAAWSGAVAEQEPAKAASADFARFDWQPARKRMKEQEVAYDY